MSALRQTYRLLEVIVIVDGRDETTERELAVFADPRLRVIVLEQNVGGSEARNRGVCAASGEWIAFLDDDDEWLPEKIARQVAAAEQLKGMPVMSSRLLAKSPYAGHVAPQRIFHQETPISEALFCRSSFAEGAYMMQTSTLLARRELLMKHPFRTGLKRHQDWDWLLRVSRVSGVSFHMSPEVLTLFRVEDGRPGTSRALDWEFSLEWAKQMREYFTPRAYSFFLATECISRAAKGRAGWRALRSIGVEFLFKGKPTFRSVLWVVAFFAASGPVRRRLRERLRGNPAGLGGPRWRPDTFSLLDS